jgi:hypothetical protein
MPQTKTVLPSRSWSGSGERARARVCVCVCAWVSVEKEHRERNFVSRIRPQQAGRVGVCAWKVRRGARRGCLHQASQPAWQHITPVPIRNLLRCTQAGPDLRFAQGFRAGCHAASLPESSPELPPRCWAAAAPTSSLRGCVAHQTSRGLALLQMLGRTPQCASSRVQRCDLKYLHIMRRHTFLVGRWRQSVGQHWRIGRIKVKAVPAGFRHVE